MDYDFVDESAVENDSRLIAFFRGLKEKEIDFLWRLADDGEKNYFYLRNLRNGRKEKTISLMDMLNCFIQKNSLIALEDLFFYYMVIKVRNKKRESDGLCGLKSLCLLINKLEGLARSTPAFLEKIDCIKISKNQLRLPDVEHWDLIYTNQSYCEDSDVIDWLIGASRLYEKEDQEKYLTYIFSLKPVMN